MKASLFVFYPREKNRCSFLKEKGRYNDREMKKEENQAIGEVTPEQAPKIKKMKRVSAKDRKAYLEECRTHAKNNSVEILSSEQAGCFFCRHVYSARDIQDWIDDEHGVSALCPECGMDAVIGDASGYPIDKAFMKEMNIAFYGEDFMAAHPDAARTYVQRYAEHKIVHKEKSEVFYIHYLRLLEARENDASAALTLGEIYLYGTQFTQPDPIEALKHFRMPPLFANATALNAIGTILLSLMESKESVQEAYECFAKAAALGSLEAAYHLYDCYSDGFFVKTDKDFAFQILLQSSGDIYNRFAILRNEWFDFPEFAVRLGECYLRGVGVARDEEMALRYFVLGDLALRLRLAFLGSERHPETAARLANGILTFKNQHQLAKNDPVYDIDSFEDSAVDFSLNPAKKVLSDVEFDPLSHELSFSISFSSPTLFLDLGNLTAGFLSGKTSWNFQDVAYAKFSSERHFTKILGDYDEGYRFAYEDDEGEDVIVAEIIFLPDKGKITIPE